MAALSDVIRDESSGPLDLLNTGSKSTMRRQIPANLSESEKLSWQKKEDARVAKEDNKLQAQQAKQAIADAREKKAKDDQEAKAEKVAAVQQSKQEKADAAQQAKDLKKEAAAQKKQAAAEIRKAAHEASAKKAADRAEKWERERDESVTQWQDFKYKAALYSQTAKHRVEITYLRRQVLSQKRIMGSILFDQLDTHNTAAAEETFIHCKKSVDGLQKQLRAKEAELKRLEEDGEGETVAKPVPGAVAKAAAEAAAEGTGKSSGGGGSVESKNENEYY
mmetsp:Transcript_42893/g.84559  ORF Transcript_42893/g.84559 Transcript_42893/m.84559 type:complete len:278 (-) Transcript_42893:206-1039(-)